MFKILNNLKTQNISIIKNNIILKTNIKIKTKMLKKFILFYLLLTLTICIKKFS